MRSVVTAVVVVGFASYPIDAAGQASTEGQRVYVQHCAACHEGTMPRMPTRDALRQYTPEAIDTALSSWAMRRQGAALSAAERRAVSEFVSGRPAGSYRPPLDEIPKSAYCNANPPARPGSFSGTAWNGWGADLQNTRFQAAPAAGLSAADVPRLKLKWAFGFPGVAASGSQATLAGQHVFVGSRNGLVYALNARTGCIEWTFEASAGVRSSPVVATGTGAGATVFFGDAHAFVYALDAASGKLRWRTKVDDHLDAMITGAVALHDRRLYVPVSSLEEFSGAMPTYECCTFRGSIAALDTATGRQLWKTHTIADPPAKTTKNSIGTQLWGPSGVAIWSAPTLDPDRNRLFVTTGDSYSSPATASSDAVMALAMDTGRVLWTRQTLPGDAWTLACIERTPEGRANCPDAKAPDFDFGSSPVLTTLTDGRRFLIAGQKSGMLYALHPDDGKLVWQTRAGDGGIMGGIEWGFAVDRTLAYVSLSSAFEKPPGEAGGIAAFRLADGGVRWRNPPAANPCDKRTGCTTGQPAAVSAIPGAIFSGSLDGHLRAYAAETGAVIWDVDTTLAVATVNGVKAGGGSLSGPGATVAGGMLYVSSGYIAGFMPGNLLLAFSVDGK